LQTAGARPSQAVIGRMELASGSGQRWQVLRARWVLKGAVPETSLALTAPTRGGVW